MASDIINAVLDRLVELLNIELAAVIDDDLDMIYCEKRPYQEDPTEVSPYVSVRLDEKGREADPDFKDDIGGGARWKMYVKLEGKIPQQATKELAYELIGKYNRRVITALRRSWNLADVTAEDGETVVFCDPRFIDFNHIGVLGGEGEWFAKFAIRCHFHTEEPASDWDEV